MKVKIICCNCDLKELKLYPQFKKGDIIEVEPMTLKYHFIPGVGRIPKKFCKVIQKMNR